MSRDTLAEKQMADTETEESSGEEVEEDDLENDDDEGEIQSRMRSNGGTVVTVITRNVKVCMVKDNTEHEGLSCRNYPGHHKTWQGRGATISRSCLTSGRRCTLIGTGDRR